MKPPAVVRARDYLDVEEIYDPALRDLVQRAEWRLQIEQHHRLNPDNTVSLGCTLTPNAAARALESWHR